MLEHWIKAQNVIVVEFVARKKRLFARQLFLWWQFLSIPGFTCDMQDRFSLNSSRLYQLLLTLLSCFSSPYLLPLDCVDLNS